MTYWKTTTPSIFGIGNNLESNDDQFAEYRKKQSDHDASVLEACPDCGAPSIMGKDHRGNDVRMHRVDRGNGYYGYDVANHDKDKD